MRRRQLLAGFGALAVTGRHAARAQQAGTPVIGFLGSASPSQWSVRLAAFRDGLAEAGLVEGRNLSIEYRWADGHNDRLPDLAKELAEHRVGVIVVLGNTASAMAAKAATTTIPVVFRVAGNPADLGLVANLGRPGGNVTGITTLGVEVGPKQLELIHEVVPAVRVGALLVNPTNPFLAVPLSRNLPEAARSLGLELHVVEASADKDFAPALEAARGLGAGWLVISADAFFNSRYDELAALILRHRLPAISPYQEFAVAGGLMSYGGSIAEGSRQAGIYTGRVLKGEKPADLPVLQSAKLELVLNQNTAKALDIAFQPAFLARADEVIE
jgi:putative ABC transport system substrate-binding protein